MTVFTSNYWLPREHCGEMGEVTQIDKKSVVDFFFFLKSDWCGEFCRFLRLAAVLAESGKSIRGDWDGDYQKNFLLVLLHCYIFIRSLLVSVPQLSGSLLEATSQCLCALSLSLSVSLSLCFCSIMTPSSCPSTVFPLDIWTEADF